MNALSHYTEPQDRPSNTQNRETTADWQIHAILDLVDRHAYPMLIDQVIEPNVNGHRTNQMSQRNSFRPK